MDGIVECADSNTFTMLYYIAQDPIMGIGNYSTKTINPMFINRAIDRLTYLRPERFMCF